MRGYDEKVDFVVARRPLLRVPRGGAALRRAGQEARRSAISRVDLNFPAYVSAGARFDHKLAKDPKTALSLSEVGGTSRIVRKTGPDPVP